MTRTAALLATTTIMIGMPGLAWGQNAASGREAYRPGSNDIVVTGRSLETEQATLPVQILAGEDLAHRRQGGLGETLAGLPGVHLDNFGGGASRP